MPPINFTGLASGLDTKALIEAILSVERRPLEQLQVRQSRLNLQKTAFDDLRSQLSALDSALNELALPSNVRGRTTTVSDESVLRASAGASAELGLFDIEVLQLAAAHKVKSDGFSAPDQGLISDGTVTIQSGSNSVITIAVSAASGNNTLQAVRDEINAADAGVSASILFDGVNHLLIVRSTETGTANGLTVSDGTNLNLASPTNEVTAAADASLTVDGISVTSSSNKVSGVIPGVTLDLLSTTSGTPITVEVAPDIDGLIGKVNALTDAFNELMDFFNEQNDRDNPGPLSGDFTVRTIQQKVQSLFAGGVEGIALGKIRSLSAIGVSFDGKTGRASVDNARLREILETRFDEVGDFLLAAGASSDPRVQYFSSTLATQSGDYDVVISQAAEQATVAGSTAIQSLNKDENLTITVGGDSTVVALAKNDQIADIVSKINTALASAGIDATASDDAGTLRITTDAYGSTADISVVSDRNNTGNGKSSGFDTTPATDTGVDVAGTIGGVAATGEGRLLTSADGVASEGLVLRILATPADVAATGGNFGTVSFSQGLVNDLRSVIDDTTRFDSGTIDVARERIDDNIEQILEDIDRIEERLSAREARLLRTFAQAERAIAFLQSQQSSLNSFTLF